MEVVLDGESLTIEKVHAVARLGAAAKLSDEAEQILRAARLVLRSVPRMACKL